MSDPIDLENARRRRMANRAALAPHFRLEPYQFDDMVGIIPGPFPIVVVTEGLNGLCMTSESARALAKALLEAAE